MTERKKVTTNTIIVFVFLFILVAAFFVYHKMNKKTFEVLQAVPEDAAFFFEFNNLSRLHDKSLNNQMWAEIKKHPAIKQIDQQVKLFDSIAFQHIKIAEVLKTGNGIISAHYIKDKFQNLILIETNHNAGFQSFDALFREIYNRQFTRLLIKHEGEKIKKLIFNNYDHPFYYSVVGNLFLGSFSEALIHESIKQLQEKKGLNNSHDLKSLKNSSGKNVDANVYINSKYFSRFLSAQSQSNSFTNNLSDYFSWIGLDLMIKDNELLLHGYSKAPDSTRHYLNTFIKQQPQDIDLTGILPYNTSLMLHKSFQDYSQYFNDYKEYLKSHNRYQAFNTGINKINRITKCNLEKFIMPYIGNEIALVSYAKRESEFKEKSYAIIKAKDGQELRRRFGRITENVAGSGIIKNYSGQTLYRIRTNHIAEYLLGDIFKSIENFNYTFINGFMVIANSSESLESFIDLYKSGKTLDLNDNYKAFTDNINQQSNFYLYSNIRNGFDLLKKYISKDLFIQLSSPDLNFTNFHATGMQITNMGGNLFTNLYLKYNAEIVEENRSRWKASLDANIKGKPFTVKNHRNNTHNIVAFDVNNDMYLFNTDGDRLWKKNINEMIQSPVYIVDYYKNGKYQYLFNTKNYLHLIDLLGRNVKGYPKKLSSPAMNALALFDYEKKKNYRIVLSGADKKVYNYNIKGSEVNGWTKTQTLHLVDQKIQHLRTNKKDYILITDKNGEIKIISRVGRDRINLKKQFGKSANSEFYINKTNKKGLFITTNKKGVLTYIKKNGAIAETIFGDFSEEHFFLYEDYNKDGHKDFIYLDGNKLRIYDRFKKPIFTYDFKTTITKKPEFYNLSKSESLLGIVSCTTQEIFLFNKRGEVIISKGLIGETPFVIQRLKNNRDLNLIVGSGSSLYNYVIK